MLPQQPTRLVVVLLRNDQAKALPRRGALIPGHKSYVVQLRRYQYWSR